MVDPTEEYGARFVGSLRETARHPPADSATLPCLLGGSSHIRVMQIEMPRNTIVKVDIDGR